MTVPLAPLSLARTALEPASDLKPAGLQPQDVCYAEPMSTAVLAIHPYASRVAIASAPGTEKAAEAFRAYNAERQAAGLGMRERIAGIVRSHAATHKGQWPTARQVARALIPDISVEPPIAKRTIQWHLKALREEAARCVSQPQTV